MGKRITLSRPRMESLAVESVDRTELFAPVLWVVGPDDFFLDDVRVTVDDVVTSVVVESVSSRGVAACIAVEEAAAVSAADCAGRLQPAANATEANTATSDSLVIDRFPESSEAPWVCAASLSPRLPAWATDPGRFPRRER
jgi:hypothetical protein